MLWGAQHEGTATGPDPAGLMRMSWYCDLRRRTPADVLPADGMQEVWGSNPHSSTGQNDNSNGSNAAYSSKVQQRRPTGSARQFWCGLGAGQGVGPNCGRHETAWAAYLLKRDCPLAFGSSGPSYWPPARASQGDLFGVRLPHVQAVSRFADGVGFRHGASGSADIPDGAERPGAGTGAGSLAHAPASRAAHLLSAALDRTQAGERKQARSRAPMRARRIRERAVIRAAHHLCAAAAAATGAMRVRPASAASARSTRVLSWPQSATYLSAGAVGLSLGHPEQAQ
jgi:hypothetical protein